LPAAALPCLHQRVAPSPYPRLPAGIRQRNLGESSLVLVDELGRGTSNRDGSSLAWAVSEGILRRQDTYCLFATHYLALSNLRNMYSSNVVGDATPMPAPT
jgi:hypothetical protein